MPRRTVRQGLEREMGTDPGLDIGRIQRQTEIVRDIRGGGMISTQEPLPRDSGQERREKYGGNASERGREKVGEKMKETCEELQDAVL